MVQRIDILSPSILAGFVAFCLTLDPLWFLGVSTAGAVFLFSLVLILSLTQRGAKADRDMIEGYPAE